MACIIYVDSHTKLFIIEVIENFSEWFSKIYILLHFWQYIPNGCLNRLIACYRNQNMAKLF